MSQRTAHFNQKMNSSCLKKPTAFLSTSLGDKQLYSSSNQSRQALRLGSFKERIKCPAVAGLTSQLTNSENHQTHNFLILLEKPGVAGFIKPARVGAPTLLADKKN